MVGRPLARFTASQFYVSLTLFAVGGALFSGWSALHWTPSWIAASLFAASALGLAALVLRPAVEIFETHLAIGKRVIAWPDVQRIDQTGWNMPFAVWLTLRGGERILVVYPGDLDSSSSLLRHLRRFSREALLDGIPYRQFWGEAPAADREKEVAAREPVRYPLLCAEDEDEVERLFQRLKSVGHLESKSSDEK